MKIEISKYEMQVLHHLTDTKLIYLFLVKKLFFFLMQLASIYYLRI